MENIDIQQEKANRLLATLQEAENHICFIESAVGTGSECTIELCSAIDAKKFLAKQLILLGKKLDGCNGHDCAEIACAMAKIGEVLTRY